MKAYNRMTREKLIEATVDRLSKLPDEPKRGVGFYRISIEKDRGEAVDGRDSAGGRKLGFFQILRR